MMIGWSKMRYPGNDPENGPARRNPINGCTGCGDTEAERYDEHGLCCFCLEELSSGLEKLEEPSNRRRSMDIRFTADPRTGVIMALHASNGAILGTGYTEGEALGSVVRSIQETIANAARESGTPEARDARLDLVDKLGAVIAGLNGIGLGPGPARAKG